MLDEGLCDLLIDPKESGVQNVLKFDHVQQLIDIGYDAAQKALQTQPFIKQSNNQVSNATEQEPH